MKPVKRIVLKFVYSIGILFFFSAAWAQASTIDRLLTAAKTSPEKQNNPYWNTLQRYLQSTANKKSATSDLSPSPRIIGGSDASASSYPWIAALLISGIANGRDATFCGGTLVEPDLVVSAAHCVKFIENSEDFEVAVGITDLRKLSANDRNAVAAFIYNPNYNESTIDNDIALIRLARPVSNAPLPYITPSLMTQVTPGKSMRLLGYGLTNVTTSQVPNQLQTALLPYVDHAICNSAYNGGLTNSQFCAGSGQGGVDACFGDSGGPLVTAINGSTYLTGVVSWGPANCAAPGTYGVYSEVADFGTWIASAADFLYLDASQFLGVIGEDQSGQHVKTIYNFTNGAVSIGALSLQLGNVGISISSDNCSNSTLAANSNCTFSVDFNPAAVNFGSHTDTLSVPNNANSNMNMEIIVYKLRAVNADTALDVSGFKWYTGGTQGNEDWTQVSGSNASHGSAMRSATIANPSFSMIATTIEGPATIAFDWKSSSDSNSYAIATINNTFLSDTLVGSSSWQQSYINLPSGTHQLVWFYAVDEFDQTTGNDHAWLDNVYVTKNSWLSYKPANSSDVYPLGKGSIHFWLLAMMALLMLSRLRQNRFTNHSVNGNSADER